MNKQQLASKIWESANRLRSKIEANEYKDYILGFIFYKFLSTQEEQYLRHDGWEDEDLLELSEDDENTVRDCREHLGYFIAYKDLFSTWLKMGHDFDVSNVTDALSSFNRLIGERHRKLFKDIFKTLDTGLSKLGDTSGARTKAISNLLQLIKDIPMDGSEDYDVLGFIYEYLISNFAANAGKKAGEFYTPHEVSVLMSEIVAWYLRAHKHISIYDPTSGSGSLLINIGRVVSRHMGDTDNIKYYAQELKENTFNLTRMNLVMRGIKPGNIEVRNADTLEEDWPFFDETHLYEPLYVDAVVSNPPYSQHWDPSESKKHDPRYANYGLAPKSKADYAFLLHDLYHLKPDGIMTIVLPHGVLFRGGEEGEIRKNLIEKNHIEAIIGLPANIFFGTGIPTIIMVLRQKRFTTDVLIVDASKHFEKVGKNNRLRASDIRRVVDVIRDRITVDKFSNLVTREEIRKNDYNLNIPRYVDSSERSESWDLLSTMVGGIPNSEIDLLGQYWDAFPGLREVLFVSDGSPYSTLRVDDVKAEVSRHPNVQAFLDDYDEAFSDFSEFLKRNLLSGLRDSNVTLTEDDITADVFSRLCSFPLVDCYDAYQLVDNAWALIGGDLETIIREGFPTTKIVDPNYVLKKKDNTEEEVQDGWVGRVIPFEMAQAYIPKLSDEVAALKAKEGRLSEISEEYQEILDSLSEDEKEGDFLNDDNTAFTAAGVKAKVQEIYKEVDSDEILALTGYIALLDKKAGKGEKLRYVAEHPDVNWNALGGSGVYTKGKVNARIKELQNVFEFEKDSFEYKMIRVLELNEEEKDVRKDIKQLAADLHNHTKEVIESLSDEEVIKVLNQKWIAPLEREIRQLSRTAVSNFTKEVVALSEKYEVTLHDIDEELLSVEKQFCVMLDDLKGSEYDMKGLAELQALLLGENHG